MGPSRGEHLLSERERERSRVVSPIQPPVPSQFTASLLQVPALVPLFSLLSPLSHHLSRITVPDGQNVIKTNGLGWVMGNCLSCCKQTATR